MSEAKTENVDRDNRAAKDQVFLLLNRLLLQETAGHRRSKALCYEDILMTIVGTSVLASGDFGDEPRAQ
ncbi:uncharacterized protein LY79DRAFT_572159 [Colletotrichum navitas]|uniref:Uncharacterized protein n=1 Tax=Colletotrichum navitas TaxID=681940 RepID=A0AAD8PKT3_9PEZI|nr:uncharacterized protein LY79DRAFT_572159 [Colletotrichum navitas]KAK1566382.1 hypothetical protein LY79DRAFT_572159 [Colletotrichum navitas]